MLTADDSLKAYFHVSSWDPSTLVWSNLRSSLVDRPTADAVLTTGTVQDIQMIDGGMYFNGTSNFTINMLNTTNRGLVTIEYVIKIRSSDTDALKRSVLTSTAAGRNALNKRYGVVGTDNSVYMGASTYSVTSTTAKVPFDEVVTLTFRGKDLDGLNFDIFINGVFIEKITSTSYYMSLDGDIQAHLGNTFKGIVYAVRIYDRPLTDKEIANNHLVGTEVGSQTLTVCNDLKGYFHANYGFDNAAGRWDNLMDGKVDSPSSYGTNLTAPITNVENGLYFDGNAYMIFTHKLYYDCTVEYIIKMRASDVTDIDRSPVTFRAVGLRPLKLRYGISGTNNYAFIGNVGSTSVPIGYSDYVVPTDQIVMLTFSTDIYAKSFDFYLNGSYATTIVPPEGTVYEPQGDVNGAIGRDFKGIVYAIRLYERKLTNQEIANNYKIGLNTGFEPPNTRMSTVRYRNSEGIMEGAQGIKVWNGASWDNKTMKWFGGTWNQST